MEIEIEAKFQNIDPDALRSKLAAAGAVLKHPEVAMKRRTYEDAEGKLRKVHGWIRVRDEGNKVTLSYKQLNDRGVHGTQEVTVTVSDFDRTCKFLEAVGFKVKAYQETRRETWMMGKAEITIDMWPWIPPLAEIEAPDEASLKDAARKLGFDWAQALHGSVENAYQAVYDVTEAEVDDWPTISFSPVPEWLEMKRKT